MTTSPAPALDLDAISVPTPCKASWEAMRGDDRVRFCASCRRNVYDLGAMTRAEAEDLIFRSEGKVCARFHRRADGRVATADCAEGRSARRGARRERAARVAAALLAIASALGAGGCGAPKNGVLRGSRMRQWPVIGAVLEWVDPTPQVRMTAGAVCMPTAAPQVPVATSTSTSASATPQAPRMLGEVSMPSRLPAPPPPAPAAAAQ